MLSLTFSNFLDPNNPPILWSLWLLLLKASAFAFYCFQICKKVAQQFKILAVLHFYNFIIIFNFTLQKAFFLLIWTKLQLFVNKYPISLNKNLLWKTTFNHLHLLLAYHIFLWEILQFQSIVLLYFEGIWK